MIRVRAAVKEDLPQLSELFDAYRVFYEKASDKAAAELFLAERMTNRESEIFTAEDTGIGKLAGFVQLYPLFSSTRMKRLWLLNDLYVDPAYRGRGISVQLIDAAKELCRHTQACALTLETAKSNEIGNKLYPQTGFESDSEHNYYSWDCK